jgi:O-antigen/teichoic acid export membrane protein
VRILDEILPSLLMQGPNQATLLLRSALRIVAVVACFHQRGTVSLAAMLGVELAANAAALIASLAYLWIFATGKSVQFGTENRYVYSKKTARDSLRYFAAQILGQCYSQSAVKLVIASTLGATGAAGYGFVQSITMTIYNYQPAIFLLGWIRPIVVSRYIRNNDPADAVAVVSIVFKVTLMLLAPLVCVFLVFGDLAGSVLSGGKHLGTGTLFVALTVVVILQGLHQLLSVLLMTFEDMKMLFRTTCLCGAASLVLWRLVPALESLGAALWLVFVETLWVVYVIQALVRSGRMGHGYSLLPYLRIVACALIVLLCAVCADLFGLSVVPAALVIVAATGAFVVCGIWSRPFVASEMHLIAGVLPNKVVRYFPGATQNIA